MKFNKRTALIGFCSLIILAGAVKSLLDNRNNAEEGILQFVTNITKKIEVETSSSSSIYKSINLDTFSWTEQEQKDAYDELFFSYQNIIKNANINKWNSDNYNNVSLNRPSDLSFSRGEVPIIEQLRESSYKALYIDNDIYVRIKADNTIEESTDRGESWQIYHPTSVSTEDYTKWLDEYDPLPNGIIRRAQLAQLKDGASVYKGTFAEQNEMYFILGNDLAQIQLLSQGVLYHNRLKHSFVLIDGEQFLIGLNRTGAIVPLPLLNELYDEMVSCNILTKEQAYQELDEKVLYLTYTGFMKPDEI